MKFSVLISVYKQDIAEYLRVALNSIYHEQELKPNQIVLVQDGELKQKQLEVISDFEKSINLDCRFDILKLKQNYGLAAALNKGLKLCRYELVARMDADDRSLPNRFLRQLKYMEEHREISVLGTAVEEYDEELLSFIRLRRNPLTDKEIKQYMKSFNPINHPSVIFRKAAVVDFGGYPEFRKAQDFALWSLLATKGIKFHNLKQAHVIMRTGGDLLARRGLDYFQYEKQILQFQLELGLINRLQFLKNYVTRFLLRIMPSNVKTILYNLR